MQIFRTNKFISVFILIFSLVAILTIASYITNWRPNTGIDDANITFVYAKNFAEGHGFVYNVGGEKVEGFSSMLWVLITSIAFKLTSSPEFWILIFNVVIVSLALSYLSNFILNYFDGYGRKFKILSVGVLLAWIGAIPNYITWSTLTLMEFGLYSSILMVILTCLFKFSTLSDNKIDRRLFYILLPLLVLVRPESLLWIPVITLLFGLIKLNNLHSLKLAIKATLLPAAIGFGSIIILIVFRLAYFGYPFPNTYYAKVSSNLFSNFKAGYDYIITFIESNQIAFFALIISFVLLIYIAATQIIKIIRFRTRIESSYLESFILSSLITVGIFICIYNGGDHFNYFRFLQPIWPLLILPILFAIRLVELKTKNITLNNRMFIILTITFAFVLFYTSNQITWHKYESQKTASLESQFRIAQEEQDQAKAVNDVFKDLKNKPNIGVTAAGGFKLLYNGPVNDLLGLNNVEMAHASGEKVGIKNHASFNKNIFYKQLPDIINHRIVEDDSFEFNNRLVVDIEFNNEIFHKLYEDIEFNEIYERAVIKPANSKYFLFGFYKKDFLDKLDKEQFQITTRPILN